MIVERTLYFAKLGRAGEVLEIRRRGSRVRVELGLPAGTIQVRSGDSDAPDVAWECVFRNSDEHRRDLEARDRSAAFSEVRKRMQALIDRFERHVLESDAVDLTSFPLEPKEHRFSSGDAELRGYLYLPPGDGPHPVVVLNHGSSVHPGSSDVSKPAVATVLLSFRIACFCPNRRGYGESPGRYWKEDVTAELGTVDYDRQLVRRLHREADDVVAALDYVRSLPRLDGEHVGVMGSSFGGTVSLLAAAKCDRFRCAIDFAGAAMNWEHTPRLRELMKQAARALEMPIFLIQAANDYSTRPTSELAEVLEREGKPHQAIIYPPFGANRDEGHWFERAGALVWGEDVRRFLERYL